jgi:CDGSH-type Zn-finger protein
MNDAVTITTRENGPLLVKGPVRVLDHLGNEFALTPGKDTIAMCRCGHSNNKPFCDGMHKTSGFQAATCAKAEGQV